MLLAHCTHGPCYQPSTSTFLQHRTSPPIRDSRDQTRSTSCEATHIVGAPSQGRTLSTQGIWECPVLCIGTKGPDQCHPWATGLSCSSCINSHRHMNISVFRVVCYPMPSCLGYIQDITNIRHLLGLPNLPGFNTHILYLIFLCIKHILQDSCNTCVVYSSELNVLKQ